MGMLQGNSRRPTPRPNYPEISPKISHYPA